MIKQYDYLEFKGELGSIRVELERVLAIKLRERDSSYFGGSYFLFDEQATETHMQIYANLNGRDECVNPKFPKAAIICEVSGIVDVVSRLTIKLLEAGGKLLITRTREIEDD